MGPINKYEAVGIFFSIAIMAVALGFLRFKDSGTKDTLAVASTNNQGAVVVASNDNPEDLSGIENALLKSATIDGELQNLVIDDVAVGTGPEVKDGDTVTAHYIGSTQDGVQFDNSYLRGEPFTFTVGDGKVIQGWDKGILGMKVGGQRILVIPASMAYGNYAVGPIKAGSTLVFAIELLAIK